MKLSNKMPILWGGRARGASSCVQGLFKIRLVFPGLGSCGSVSPQRVFGKVPLRPKDLSGSPGDLPYVLHYSFFKYRLEFIGGMFLDYLFEYRLEFVGGMFLDPAQK